MTDLEPSRCRPQPSSWRTSTYTGRDNNCLEHGVLNGAEQAVRDTMDPARKTTLTFPAPAWQAFLNAVAGAVI
ncbi:MULTISPECIES: DUF397 domain-containing protein [Streptomyces]|uniref:DUF397 domain-containing protein n=1 Tax=Streptomyces TaxID=1883 RepID=UPI001CCC783A|nr:MULTISPECIES: DUF397 domain-containing protein [Streptomyces]UBI39135.1 DUF397 domain-containing protein [Streptomyces mobaraensis]UKW31715.1 DUF397 domain-containing protein [Streptomyces sp. TYQ1024]